MTKSTNRRFVLNHRNAFMPGANLWIISDINTSRWTKKINWYLNFQIYKFKKVKELSEDQLISLKETGFEFNNIKSDNKSLLIFSEKLLTNEKTLLIEFNDIISWIGLAKKYWENLNKPSLRFFAPDLVNVDELKPHLSCFKDVSLVEPCRV